MLFWLAQSTIVAGLLAIVVAIACRFGRFRPAVRHALWLVVLLKLVTPPLLTWPGITLVMGSEASEEGALAEDADQLAQEPLAQAPEPQSYQILAPSPHDVIMSFAAPVEHFEPATETAVVPMDTISHEEEKPASADPVTTGDQAPMPSHSAMSQWPDWLIPAALQAIVLGALAMTVLQLVRLARFQLLLAHGRTAPANLTNEVKRLAAQLGVRPPSIRVLPDIASPLVCGLGRPLLLWPAVLLDSLAPECQRAVIVHELAHLRRRDHWVAWLRTVAGCVWWWNPLYWYVCKQLGRAAELACDAWVVAALPEARRAYAEALLAVAQMVSKRATPAPAVGMSVGRQDFERRLTMIMCERVPYKAPVLGLVVIGVLTLAVLPGLSVGQKSAEPAKKKQEPAKPTTTQDVVVPIVVGDAVYSVDFVNSEDLVLQAAPADERDRRLKNLEDKLQALIKEVKSLRETKPGTATTTKIKPTDKPAAKANWTTVDTVSNAYAVQAQPWVTSTYTILAADDKNQGVITLSRATYKLPKDKADALAAFLPHIKTTVLESKVEGEGIVVTTTPEVQHTIGHLVSLMLGKPQGANVHKQWSVPTTAAPVEKKP
jgi:beta-lactamase regulating signal transducer with metallopeptidase domain